MLDHHLFDDGCPECEIARGLLGLEIELRTLSLDLWVAGWTPDDLIAHVRCDVGDPLAADLVAHVLVVDDSHRADHARPADWVRSVDRLRASIGVDPDELGFGWLAGWLLANSRPGAAAGLAEVVWSLRGCLLELVAPTAERC